MHPVIARTFGGLSPQYYFRQLFFGALIGAFFLYIVTKATHGLDPVAVTLVVINTLLYPYARFVYESIAGFILGDNFIIAGLGFMLMLKWITMVMCWGGAIFIAPVGLVYLYWHHRKETMRDV